MSDYNIEDNLVQALTRAVDEGIRIGADLAAMHGSNATSQELEKAFFNGCEVGYKKASEELQPYIDLYQDLADKAEKVAREVIDKYPKWISVTDIEHLSTDSNLVGYFGGGAFDQLRWYDFVWTRNDGTLISENRERDVMNEHCIAVFKLPEPPKENEKNG